MTREEAIQVLNGILKLNYREWWDEECDEAIDMAIESLSEPSLKAIKKQIDEHWYLDKSDLISRADAIEAVENNSYGMGSRASVKAIKALPSAELPKGDLISRADAIEMAVDVEAPQGTYERAIYIDDLMALPSADATKVAYICDGRKCDNDCSECFRTLDIEYARDFKLMGDTYYQEESADAEPTVIRSKTLMPTKDFKEWAKRVREDNPNAVVIPCDAEVVSAESVVRCKDCRYFKKIVERSDSGLCHRDIVASAWKENGYCSRGEKK